MSLGQPANNGENLCQKVKELGGGGGGVWAAQLAECLPRGSVIHTHPTLHKPSTAAHTCNSAVELRGKVQGYS